MAVQPIQSSASLSLQQSEKISVSGTIQTKSGDSISFSAQVEESDAVQISLSQGQDPSGAQGAGAQGAQGAHHHRHGGHRAERAEKNYQNIDTNGDGSLSKDELSAAQQQRQANGHQTPFIDQALKNYDQLSQASGTGGVTLQQFYGRDGKGSDAPAAPSTPAAAGSTPPPTTNVVA